jgi:hypothetical protein
LRPANGKEEEIEEFLRSGLPLAGRTGRSRLGVRLGPSTFAIFDVFTDEAGRQVHLSGRLTAALMAKAPELFATPPLIEKVDVLAAKLP